MHSAAILALGLLASLASVDAFGFGDNPCDPNPCQNGGACTALGESYFCTCMEGFSGATCGDNADPCTPNPCQNSGSCTASGSSYSCACLEGFSGDSCEVNMDDCASQPCKYGATCVDGVNSYTCSCTPGFSGTNCTVATCDNADPCQDVVSCLEQATSNRLNPQRVNKLSSTCTNGGTFARMISRLMIMLADRQSEKLGTIVGCCTDN